MSKYLTDDEVLGPQARVQYLSDDEVLGVGTDGSGSAPDRSALDVVKDVGVTALKAAVGLPQSIVGLADIPTGGRVGKALEGLGYRPEDAKKILDSWYSPAQQQADRRVREADGFFGTLEAAIENPSVIATTVGESIPQMIGGAAVGRGLIAASGGKVAPWVAGGVGEGVMGAGASASQIRSETEDGLLTPKQSGAALASGVGTAALGAAGGKIAQRMGVPDVDTMLAAGRLPKNPAGFAKAIVGAGISEGAFEELPQSVQEQMWQNYALDKPLTDGVGNAAALGLLSGAAMGGAGGGFNAALASARSGQEGVDGRDDDPPPAGDEGPAQPPAPPLPATAEQPAPVASETPLPATQQPEGSDQPTLPPNETDDLEVRLAELEILAEQRELTDGERVEFAGLLAQLEQDGTSTVEPVTPAGAPAAETVDPVVDTPEPSAAPEDPVTATPAPEVVDLAAPSPVTATDTAQPQPQGERPTNFWTFAKTRGFQPGQLRVGTPDHTRLKAEFDAMRAGIVPAAPVETSAPTAPQAQGEAPKRAATDFWSWLKQEKGLAPAQIKVGTPEHAALKADFDALRSGAPVPQALPAEPLQASPDPALQNRDRSRLASVAQMSEIARNPDYMRLGPSRSPESGAPMVFAVGDDTTNIPFENLGREDVAVMSDGQRVPFRYAVLDASTVNPSNFADGRQNPEFGSTVNGTVKALNNGRTAGLRAAHEMGTAGRYVQDLASDTDLHGVSPDVIARTRNPVLVRLYAERSNTNDMAARSQSQALGMSPAELARQDAPLLDSSVLSSYVPGDVASASNRDFVRAFVGKLQAAGQDVAGMMQANGEISQDGRKRIQAAMMQSAYGNADLVEEMFDSTDTDIKAIGESLKALAGAWANMRDSARVGAINPQADVTENLVQAVNLIRRARRERLSLADLVRQPDLMTGETPDALTVQLLRVFYDGQYLTRARGRDKVVALLGDYVQGAMATSADAGLFGGEPVSAADILATIVGQPGAVNEQAQSQEGGGEPAGSGPAGLGDGQARPAGQQPVASGGRRGASADRRGEPGQDAEAEAEQQTGAGDQGAEEGDGAGQGRSDGGQQGEPEGRGGVADERAQGVEAGRGRVATLIAEAKERIRSALGMARQDKRYAQSHTLFPVSPAEVEEAARNGLDIDGYSHAVDGSALRHVLKNHGNPSRETARGQIAVTDADIESIPEILAAPDRIVYGLKNGIGRDMVVYLKTMPDGTTVYLEEVRTGRKTLTTQSMRRYPRTTSAASIEKALRPTSETLPGDRDSVAGHPGRRNQSGQVASGGGAGGDTSAEPAAESARSEQKNPAPAKRKPKKADPLAAVVDYFTPGNIVPNFSGGFDRVLEFTPGEDGRWSVRVQGVRKDGDAWVPVEGERARVHSTAPSGREMAKGPAERAEAQADKDAKRDTSPDLDEARRVVKDGRQGKLKQSLLKSAIERAEAGGAGDLASRLAASKAEIEKQAKKSAVEEDASEAEIERLAQAIARADTARVIERKLRELNESRGTGTSSDLAWGTGGGGNYIRDLRVLERALEIANSAPPGGKIEDFGEKLGGARKDQAPSLSKELTDEAIAAEPFSKIWPADEAAGIEDTFAAAVATAARAEVTAKPRVAYKLKQWVEKVKGVRSLATRITSGQLTREEFLARLAERSALEGFAAKVRLLEMIDRAHWKRIGAVREYPDAYRYDGETKIPAPQVLVELDGKNHRLDGAKTVDEALPQVNDLLGLEVMAKRMQFEVRGSGDRFFINKKGDREYRKLKTFGTAKEALAYRDANYDELVAAWEAVKDTDNVRERDVRAAENRPRTGADHRNGADVTPERFMEAFGFRGIEWGNWVAQGSNAKERQGMLNQAFDALMDLAQIVGVPPKALSLNGTLGLGFGSRGHGWASAHFEPGNLVINLTKTRGAGALAHEWFHALDNYFSRQRGGEVAITRGLNAQAAYRDRNFITHRPEPLFVPKSGQRPPMTKARLESMWESMGRKPESPWNPEKWQRDPNHPHGVRPEVERAFAELVDALNSSPMVERARALEKGSGDYWSRTLEIAARAFENFVIARMMEKGFHNDYLANVVAIEDFPRAKSRYPYLLPDEIAPIAEAFDALFATIETRETDTGVAMFSRRGWRKDFPDAVLGHRQGVAQAHPDYEAAKAGDDRAALRLARDLVSNEYVEAVRAALPDGARPTIVPVLAVEASGNNRIPLMVAKVLGEKLGLKVEVGVFQSRKVGRGGSDGFHRLANPPSFTGAVGPGDYLILDDTLTQGGTLAQLKTHIEDSGGRVLLASALTGKGYSATIALSNERLAQLRDRYGSIEPWWRDTFGHGFDGLTESEARFILSLRDRPGPDALRDRVTEARVRGLGGLGGRDDSDGRDRPPLARGTGPASGLDALGQAWAAAGIESALSERNGVISVSKIVVPPAMRERGAGTRAMQQLVEFADANGLHIALTPSADFGGNKARLKKFYRRFGFVENKGRNRAFTVSEAMVRVSPNGPTLFSRSAATQQAFEARIDALFAGEPAQRVGAKVLDRSDVLDMLGLGDGPVYLAEGKVLQGRENHPRMTADVWKKIPQWLDDPAAVFESDTVKGRVVFVTPELVGGAPVLIVVEPNAGISAALQAHLLVNSYDAGGRTPYQRWVNDGLAKYVDQKKFPDVLARAGLQLPRKAENKPGTKKILTEKNLAGYRRNRGGAMSRTAAGTGLSVANVTRLADAIRRTWANGPEVVVVADLQDPKVPQRVREYDAEQRSQGAEGEPEGFFYEGKVYLVAGQLASPADVVRVLSHEALGHYGLRGLFGDRLSGILDQIVIARADEVRAKAADYGLPVTLAQATAVVRERSPALSDDQVEKQARILMRDSRRIAAEEVLAVMAQTNPQLGFVRRAVAAVRSWLRSLGVDLKLSDNDIIAQFIIPARQWVARGGKAGDSPAVALNYSRQSGLEDDAFVGEVLAELAQHDEVFRYPVSKKSTLDGVMAEVFPTARYLGEDTRADERQESGADTRHVFRTSGGKNLYVFERGNEVWLDVSRLEEGEGGSGFYAGVMNYAHNARKVLIGDPAGLSEAAVVRRTSAMLSSALRFGTTRHLGAAPEQLAGIPEKGIQPLRWDGDDFAKTTALIETFLGTLYTQFPGLKDYRYDFRGNRFVDRGGRPLDAARLEHGKRTPAARGSRAGQATLRRGIFLKSLVESASGERPRLLEQVLTRSRSIVRDGGLGAMFSRSSLGAPAPQPPGPSSRLQRLKAKVLDLTSAERVDALLYEMQDRFIDLKRLRDHIREIGGTITDLNDAYLGEELYHKRLAKRTEDFLKAELKPLLADLRARELDLPTLERFLHARHAPEANRVLAERNPDQQTIDAKQASARADVRALELQLQSAQAKGAATKSIEQALEQAREEVARWRGAQAFQGTEAERLSLSGMTDDEAQAFMDSLPAGRRAHLDALAARVDSMNAKTLDLLEKYGLMDSATLAAWRATYQFYVPLHRDEAHPDATTHPIGQGFSTKGDAGKRRTGSNERVTNILAHIAMQREAALTRGEKNRVAKKLYLMAAQNPDASVWTIDKPPKLRTVDQATGIVRTGVDPLYKTKPNVVMVRIAGKDRAIVFNERNPRAMRLAQAIKSADLGDLNAFDTLMGKATRWLASVNTQYNPVFGLINFARDTQAAALQLSTTPLAGRQDDVIHPASLWAAMRAIYRDRRGKRPTDPTWSKLWDDMQGAGGTTGYRELFIRPDDRARALAKELGALERGQVSQAAHAVVDWLSDYNEVMENAVRLSAFKVALDSGMSRERAASLAKNLTVNFNRRGRQTARLGAYYAFLNAAIQGSTRMVETLRGPAGRKIMLGGVMLGALNTLIGLAVMGPDDEDDDDRWEQIPEFVKERSLIIPIGREDYLAIPMPLGFHVLPNIGRKAVEMMFHKDPSKGAGKHVTEMATLILDAFNPLGGSENLAQMVTPTPFDPAVALLQNRDWTGRTIYLENYNPLNPTPGHQRKKDSASKTSQLVSEALNKVTGGTEYRPGAISWTPDQIDFVIGQLTGGLGREILKAEQTITTPFTGEELPPHKIPLVGRVYGNTRGPSSSSGAFYENVKALNELENELKGRIKDGGDVQALREAEPLVRMIGIGNAAESQMRKLRQQRRDVLRRAEPGYRDEIKLLNDRMGEVMTRLNREVRQAQLAEQ